MASMVDTPGAAGIDQRTLSIVLPAHNEAPNIGPLVQEITTVFDDESELPYTVEEIIVVDDGSTDQTWETITDLAQSIPELRGLRLRRNFGQSAALSAGIDHSIGDIVITMDADLQNDPHDIPALLEKLEDGYDCVSGWRRDRNDPLLKTVPSKIQTYLAWLTGPKIHDFGCTLKAYRGEAIRNIDLYGEGHRYIPAKLHQDGYRITELPITHRPREHGRSKYGSGRLLRGFLDLLFHAFWNRYSARPLHFLGGIGTVVFLVGFGIGVHATVLKYGFGESLADHTPRLILTVALVLFGLQLVMFGFLAEMVAKLQLEGKQPYRVETTLGYEHDADQ